MLALTRIGSSFLAPGAYNTSYGGKSVKLAKALVVQYVAAVAGIVIHELGHALAIGAFFKTANRVIVFAGGMCAANVWQPHVLSDLGSKMGLSVAFAVVNAAGPLTHAMSVLLCTCLWKKNQEWLRALNATCLHGILYTLDRADITDYGNIRYEVGSGYAYLVALAEIVIGSWSLYQSMDPLVSGKSLISRSVQLIDRLEKSPSALNSVMSRMVVIGIGLLLVGKMASSLLGAACYRTISVIATTKKRRTDLGGRVTCSLQEAQRCAQSIQVVIGKVLWKPSLARAELSRFGLCSPGWLRVTAKVIGLHLLLPGVLMQLGQLVDIAARGQLVEVLRTRQVTIDPDNEFTLWKWDLPLIDRIHPERLVGSWRWMIHKPSLVVRPMIAGAIAGVMIVLLFFKKTDTAVKSAEKPKRLNA